MKAYRRAGIVALALLFIVGALLGRPEHPHGWWQRIPGFLGLFGFAGTWLLVFVAKSLLARWLERPRGYYGG